jgi:hypothetical protein
LIPVELALGTRGESKGIIKAFVNLVFLALLLLKVIGFRACFLIDVGRGDFTLFFQFLEVLVPKLFSLLNPKTI